MGYFDCYWHEYFKWSAHLEMFSKKNGDVQYIFYPLYTFKNCYIIYLKGNQNRLEIKQSNIKQLQVSAKPQHSDKTANGLT